ncbi:MFS transporter [Myceligenerans xiligouense]|uniref:Putative MFS family arabinose efflux permease n=1 Tax=Myceligenerans xiligouense TaxID=253184 RepID=A0A3N4Z4U5_9MICO|nr:MFS transporter [Myceligenerans xiligouense]RPF20938.1 putative MFS family arabinose efflux permease [Myceligenerans xiligouense]
MTTARTVEPPPAAATRTGWGVLAVVCGALFLEGIDIAMLNVAVPAIAADIGLATADAHWVISAYVLAYGGFMILGGRTADLVGRRRTFLVALAVFVAFSGVGGLADDAWVLLVARFVTGATAGFMTPAGFSLLTTSFPAGPLRDRALAIYGAIGAGGFTLGVVAGGFLTDVGWRWVFFAPVIVGALLWVAGRAIIRADEAGRIPRRGFDLGGAVTLTSAMVVLIYGVVEVGEGRWLTTGIASFAAAAVLLLSFVVIERRAAAPLLRLAVLRAGLLLPASVAGLLVIGSFFAFQFLVTLYLQEFRGWSPVATGLAFAVMGADMILAPLVTHRLVQRFGNIPVMVAGVLAGVVAFALALRIDGAWGYLELLPSMFLVAVMFALVYGPLAAAATDGLDDAEHGIAGGVVYTAFQFGAALGVSAATIALVGGHSGTAGEADYQRALLVPVMGSALALILGVLTWIRGRRAA